MGALGSCSGMQGCDSTDHSCSLVATSRALAQHGLPSTRGCTCRARACSNSLSVGSSGMDTLRLETSRPGGGGAGNPPWRGGAGVVPRLGGATPRPGGGGAAGRWRQVAPGKCSS